MKGKEYGNAAPVGLGAHGGDTKFIIVLTKVDLVQFSLVRRRPVMRALDLDYLVVHLRFLGIP